MRATQHREDVQEVKAIVQAKPRATITYDDVNIFGDSSITANIDMEEIEEFGKDFLNKLSSESDIEASVKVMLIRVVMWFYQYNIWITVLMKI